MSLGGAHLTITLGVEEGRVVPALDLAPGADATRLFFGRAPADVARLVPLIFNLCGAAQGRAARAALGLPPAEGDAPALHLEHVRDHALCLARAWPAAFALPADADCLRLAAGLASGDGAAQSGLLRHLVGQAGDLGQIGVKALVRLLEAGETPLFRLLALARRRLRPDWGRIELPAPSPADLTARLTGRAAPLREASCLEPLRPLPLMAEIEEAEGRSLFLRMMGRVLDLLRHLDPAGPTVPGWSPGRGIGIAQAVRGPLGHRAVLADGAVERYRVVTPTDWNLAPGGALAQALSKLPVGDMLSVTARLVVSCINPCVPTVLVAGGRKVDLHA
ncbi:nickel-dependent hydrogenase large subunit [Zavarzinia sp.]|uniref:nickel-dependent hydrogenase large subunit n=1 Tax=Zavarzinia sp. TaxID=2027920 RepID=UPI003566D4C5